MSESLIPEPLCVRPRQPIQLRVAATSIISFEPGEAHIILAGMGVCPQVRMMTASVAFNILDYTLAHSREALRDERNASVNPMKAC